MSLIPERRAWSLVTKTEGGTVSILRDLTLVECRNAYEALDPWRGITAISYQSEEGGSVSFGEGSRTINAGDIQMREVFGPDDWDRSEMEAWAHWPKHEYIKIDDPRHYSKRRQK